jgi:hypothetical protein
VKAELNVLRQRLICVQLLLGRHLEYSAYEYVYRVSGVASVTIMNYSEVS